MDLLIAVVGGGVGAGIINLITKVIERKWSKEDTKENKLEEKMDALSNKVDSIMVAQKVLMVDRVKHVGAEYIDAGEISLADKEGLQEMYQAYKGLNGNGHLDLTMREVDKLKVVGANHEE